MVQNKLSKMNDNDSIYFQRELNINHLDIHLHNSLLELITYFEDKLNNYCYLVHYKQHNHYYNIYIHYLKHHDMYCPNK